MHVHTSDIEQSLRFRVDPFSSDVRLLKEKTRCLEPRPGLQMMLIICQMMNTSVEMVEPMLALVEANLTRGTHAFTARNCTSRVECLAFPSSLSQIMGRLESRCAALMAKQKLSNER
jgi:hypothetical protein